MTRPVLQLRDVIFRVEDYRRRVCEAVAERSKWNAEALDGYFDHERKKLVDWFASQNVDLLT